MLGMMAFGATGCCGGMISGMGGMMDGGGIVWGWIGMLLIAAILVGLIFLVIRGDRRSVKYDKAA